ncbi:hypothetical protein [Mammaliicoccus sciuri]|uniref:hypothetical protein n=1 Tax=Mammaliicoccus sciuri TaxID=1296 RepID=UPI003CFB05DD
MPTIKYTREDITKLENERDQYKLQRDELSEKLDKECNDNYKLEGQLHDMTKQRDSLIKDVEKLREEKEDLKRLGYETYKDAVKYKTLTEHIRLKALHNPSVSRYKDLMHFKDELEAD